MVTKRIFIGMGAAFLLLAGCGPGDACTQLENAFNLLSDRLTACSATNGFTYSSCEAGLSSCSPSDVQTLESLSNCVNQIPADNCTTDPNAVSTAQTDVENCGTNAGDISSACASATGID
jgi:hypothetical protein